jgi:hypothetical protein
VVTYRARKNYRRQLAAENHQAYSYMPANLPGQEEPLERCWNGCLSQNIDWGPGGAVTLCARGDHPVCVDCQHAPVDEEFEICGACAAGIARAEREFVHAREMSDILTRCLGSCISEQKVDPSIDRDSASSTCALCHNKVCMVCGRVPLPQREDFCDSCGHDLAAQMAGAWPDETPDREKARQELTKVVAQIVRVSGQPFDVVNRMLNQKMGVRRRADATSWQIQAGITAGQTWLRQQGGRGPASDARRG